MGMFQELLQSVLKLASESDIPDLRDRGFMYWRLLSADPEAAKDVVLCRGRRPSPLRSGDVPPSRSRQEDNASTRRFNL